MACLLFYVHLTWSQNHCPASRGLRLMLPPYLRICDFKSEPLPRFEGIETFFRHPTRAIYISGQNHCPASRGLRRVSAGRSVPDTMPSEPLPRFEGIETTPL